MSATMSDAYTDHGKGLSRHSLFKLNNQQLSEDLVQDTYLKTWSYLVRGGKIDIMRSFLYHTLNCLIIDEYRKRGTSSLDALVEKGFEPGEDKTETLINQLDGGIALTLLDKLPEKYKAILTLRYIKLLSLEEMSALTGQTKNALSVQIHRGLTKLKTLYTHEA
jgi:RNA polymerase sigma-70 factor (ECF subfamily)